MSCNNLSFNLLISLVAILLVGGFVTLVTFNTLSKDGPNTASTQALDAKQGGNPDPSIPLVCSSYVDYSDPTVLMTPDDIFDDETTEFPKDFTWGVATSAYQIEGAVQEGGRGPSIWDTFSHTRGKVYNNSNGDIACDHYHLFKEDIAIMKEMGMKSYRFSIAWPRILPLGTIESEGETREFDFYYDTEVDISKLTGIEAGGGNTKEKTETVTETETPKKKKKEKTTETTEEDTTKKKTKKTNTKEEVESTKLSSEISSRDFELDSEHEVEQLDSDVDGNENSNRLRRLAPSDSEKASETKKVKEEKANPNKFKYQVKGGINQEGLDFYGQLIDELLEAGIEPYVTLYHWDLPQALQDKGGWLNDTIATEWFPRYADIIFNEYGDRVKTWITINEPWVVTMLGYGKGYMAPGLKDTVRGSYRVAHNLLRAHAYSVELYRKKYQKKQKGVIGITLNSDYKQAQCPSVATSEYEQVMKNLNEKEKAVLEAVHQPKKNKEMAMDNYRKKDSTKKKTETEKEEESSQSSPRMIHELERQEIEDQKQRKKELEKLDYRSVLLAKAAENNENLSSGEINYKKKSTPTDATTTATSTSKKEQKEKDEKDLQAFQEDREEYESCLVDDYKQMWMASAIQWESDEEAANRAQQFYLGWFADPLFMGDYPPIMRENVGDRLPKFSEKESELLMDSHDFFGLNHYTTQTVTPAKVSLTGRYEYDMQVEETQDKRWHRGESPWLYSVPWGFRKLLKWIKNRYGSPPIYVTENGVCAPFESLKPAKEAVDDVFRQDFIKGYLSEMYKAITFDDVDVKGFFYWSLLDNFEWAEGYVPRFGIVRVDYETQERTIKESGKLYAKLAEQYSN